MLDTTLNQSRTEARLPELLLPKINSHSEEKVLSYPLKFNTAMKNSQVELDSVTKNEFEKRNPSEYSRSLFDSQVQLKSVSPLNCNSITFINTSSVNNSRSARRFKLGDS